jgi:hypothetical protein
MIGDAEQQKQVKKKQQQHTRTNKSTKRCKNGDNIDHSV